MSANEIVIEEVSGSTRARVVLRGRAMPYQGIDTGGEMHVVTTWYQGNPKATQQVMGPRTMPTTLNGTWKAKFVRVRAAPSSTADVEASGLDMNLPEEDSAFVEDHVIEANRVVEIFERLRDRGKEVRFTWGSIVRYGMLVEFTPNWDRLEDVRWSLTFDWNGTDRESPALPASTELVQPIIQQLTKTDDALVSVPYTTVPRDRLGSVFRFMSAIRSRSLDVLAYSRKAISAVTVPVRIVQGLTSTVADMRDDVTILSSQVLGETYEAYSTIDSVVEVMKSEKWRRDLGIQAETLAIRSLEERNKLHDLTAAQTETQVVQLQSGETLRHVAQKLYGTEADWPIIAEANGFTSSTLPEGTFVFVPIRQTQAAGSVVQ